MSATREITIWCDGEDCGLFEQVTTTKPSIARSKLMPIGWSCTPAGDFCPECVEERKSGEPTAAQFRACGYLIKELVACSGLTLSRMAKAAMIGEDDLLHIVRGYIEPSPSVMKRIVQAALEAKKP